MAKKTQTISIRLLRDGREPLDSVRKGVTLTSWGKLDGALISLGTIGGDAPKWSKFMELTAAEAGALTNLTAFGLVFVPVGGRRFAASFGLGHVKLDPDAFEQDFGLRVVLNTVAPDKLRSADVRTPDENTTSRRTQTARRSDQTAFSIDIERDIVRGLAGEPKDSAFALRVAGSDGLSLTKEMEIAELPQVCADAFAAFGKTDYKADFAWFDQIKHVRDKATIELLDAALVAALNGALTGGIPGELHLAYPVIYDPEKARHIRYKGFGSTNVHTDMEIGGYIADMRAKGLTSYTPELLTNHRVAEVNAEGHDEGQKWRVKECLVFETDLNSERYVLSADRWYRIDSNLATQVTNFFAQIPSHTIPPALADENEEKYNKRIAQAGHPMLCMDRQLVTPSGATSAIEACDFLQNDGAMVHIKDQTSSSRLSHLFNQGTVSARVMKLDGPFRDRLLAKITAQETALNRTGYRALVAGATGTFDPAAHRIVYAVICSGPAAAAKRLPFFSLVTFRQAATELRALGYDCSFAWIEKPASTTSKAKRQKKS